jgi:hypothetical protein
MHVVYYGSAESFNTAVQETKRVRNIFLCSTECKCFEENDSHGDDPKKGADGCMAEVVSWIKVIDYYLKHIAAGVDDFCDVSPVIFAVPLQQCAVWYSTTLAISWRLGSAVRLQVLLHRRVVGALFDNGLQSKRIQIDASILVLNDENAAKLLRY